MPTDRLEQLNRLLTKELDNILKRERHNEDTVHLYSMGEYWTAFERSAYLLDQLSSAEPLVIYLEEYPFPIVMCAAHDREVSALCRKGKSLTMNMNYRQLLSRPIDSKGYAAWYKRHIEDE